MEFLKTLLGEELYVKVREKLGDKKLILDDGSWIKKEGMIPKARLDEVIQQRDDLKQQLADRDQQLEDLKKKAGSSDELQAEIERLKGENENSKAEYQKKLKSLTLNQKIDAALVDAQAQQKYMNLLKKEIDREKLVLNEDGTVTGLSDQMTALKENYKEFFGEQKRVGSDEHGGDDSDISNIKNPWSQKDFNLTEQAKIIKSDPALAEKLKKAAKK